MSAPQTYGASLYDLAKDEGMSREILVDLEGIVSLFNEHCRCGRKNYRQKIN